MQLVPAHVPRCTKPRGPLAFGVADQSERCHLRVGDDREAGDVGDIRRREVHCSAELPDPAGGGIHVVHSGKSNPLRRRAGSARIRRQSHQTGDRDAFSGKLGIDQPRIEAAAVPQPMTLA